MQKIIVFSLTHFPAPTYFPWKTISANWKQRTTTETISVYANVYRYIIYLTRTQNHTLYTKLFVECAIFGVCSTNERVILPCFRNKYKPADKRTKQQKKDVLTHTSELLGVRSPPHPKHNNVSWCSKHGLEDFCFFIEEKCFSSGLLSTEIETTKRFLVSESCGSESDLYDVHATLLLLHLIPVYRIIHMERWICRGK